MLIDIIVTLTANFLKNILDEGNNDRTEIISNNSNSVTSNNNGNVAEILLDAIKMKNIKEEESLKKEIDELISIQDIGFTIKITAPNAEPFELQVCNLNVKGLKFRFAPGQINRAF